MTERSDEAIPNDPVMHENRAETTVPPEPDHAETQSDLTTAAGDSAAAADDFADGQPRQLALNSITVDRMGAWIVAGIIGLPTLAAVITLWYVLELPLIANLGMLFGWLLLVGWLLWGATIYPRLAYNHASYTLSPLGIEIRRGVYFRHVHNIPRSRVQHTDVRHGPIARHFGLATLIIHTAGTQNHTVTLGGLQRETAMRIRDYLIRGSERDGV